MSKVVSVNQKIKSFKRSIIVPGDKSLSIRWVLFASLANGMSTAKNLLMSEDVLAAIEAVKKLGVRVFVKKNECKIHGNGIDGYKFKNNITINAAKKLGIKITTTKKECKIYGKGIDGYIYKKNLTIDARNSGTLGRLILGLLINSTKPIKLIGD